MRLGLQRLPELLELPKSPRLVVALVYALERRSISLLSVLLSLLSVQCSLANSSTKPSTSNANAGITASLRSISAKAFDNKHANIELEIDIDNPGPETLISGLKYELLLQERGFSVGTVVLHSTVSQGSHLRLTLPLQLVYLDLPRAIRNQFKSGRALDLVFRGKLVASTGGSAAAVGLLELDGQTELLSSGAE